MSDYTIVITSNATNLPVSACKDEKWFACEPDDGAMSNFWDMSHGWEAAGGAARAELAQEGVALDLMGFPATEVEKANEVWLTDHIGKVILRLVAE